MQKSPNHLQVPVNAELIKLKESSSNGKIIRKRITSKISQHRLNVNPSTIMSMNSLEQSSTIQPMKAPIGIDSVTPTLEMDQQNSSEREKINLSPPDVLSADEQYNLSPSELGVAIEQQKNMFPSIDTLSVKMVAQPPQTGDASPSVTNLAGEFACTPFDATRLISSPISGTATPQLPSNEEEEDT